MQVGRGRTGGTSPGLRSVLQFGGGGAIERLESQQNAWQFCETFATDRPSAVSILALVGLFCFNRYPFDEPSSY